MAVNAKRTTLVGLLIGTGLALIAAFGPLVSAITITVGVETQVGDASGRLLSSSQPDSLSAKETVLDLLGAKPNATWRTVREHTGLSDANAKRALTTARKALRNGC